jgi:hypothetical protein
MAWGYVSLFEMYWDASGDNLRPILVRLKPRLRLLADLFSQSGDLWRTFAWDLLMALLRFTSIRAVVQTSRCSRGFSRKKRGCCGNPRHLVMPAPTSLCQGEDYNGHSSRGLQGSKPGPTFIRAD